VMMLTHRKELIAQNYEKLLTVWPEAPAGIYSAGLGEKNHFLPITFAGIASVANKAHLFGKVDIAIVDEAHLISPNDETTYRKFLNELLKVNPYLKVIGLTATPWRIGQGKLTDEGGLFTDICYDNTSMEKFNALIADGYLAKLIPKRTHLKIDTDALHMRGGDFIQSEVIATFDKDEITEAALKETLTVAHDRNHGMIFGAGIDHCLHIEKMLKAMGQTCGVVHSKQKADLNDHIIKEFKNGNIRFLINNDKLTTGFDAPCVDLIVILRATASIVLWVQVLGRATRPVYAEGFNLETKEGRLAAIEAGPKADGALILDFAGNTQRLGCINDPVLPKKKGKGGGDAPVKECPDCMTLNHPSVRFCIDCGYEFSFEVKITQTASTNELIKESVIPVIEPFPVVSMSYQNNQRRGKRPSLKVTYQSTLRAFSEYLCLEHEIPGVRHKAGKTWSELGGKFPAPATVVEALTRTGELRPPHTIRVWLNKEWPEITSKEFHA
jgi:DNA repair protein RadD